MKNFPLRTSQRPARKAPIAILAAFAALALSVTGSPARAFDRDAAMVAAGEQVFQKCKACHTPESSKNTFGPSLVGVIGRKAGTLPRFAYSDALKNSGITWTEDKLRLWMADNESLVPGTRMRHVSVTDPIEQDYLLSYIGSLGE